MATGDIIVSVGVPLGLQDLVPLSSVKIKRQFQWFSRKYNIVTEDGEQLLMVAKGSGMKMDLSDANGHLVMNLKRTVSWCSSKMKVSVLGVLTSIVRQETSAFKSVFSINDANDTPVLRIKGNTDFGSFNTKYEVQGLDKSHVGTIMRRWTSSSWHVEFPVDMDTRFKGIIITSAIYIDYILAARSR